MGSRTSKEIEDAESRNQRFSRQDMALCLASLSEMAHTGCDTGSQLYDKPPDCVPSPEATQTLQLRLRSKLQQRLRGNEEQAFSEHVQKQLQLLDSLETQDDSEDWVSMRRWVVWTLRSNLDDEDDIDDILYGHTPPPNPKRSYLSRQVALDTPTQRDRHRMLRTNINSNSTGSDDTDKGSAQNSFDSTNGNDT